MRLLAAETPVTWYRAMRDRAAPTILVVDAEPQILQVIRVILSANRAAVRLRRSGGASLIPENIHECSLESREGCQIIAVRTIREAVRISERRPGPIHLVLIDALIPEASDPELLARLCSGRPELKIIVMSDCDLSSWPGPPAGFLLKPFTPETLWQAVSAALSPGSHPPIE